MEVTTKLFFRRKSGEVVQERTIKERMDPEYSAMLSAMLTSISDHWYWQGTFVPVGRVL